MAASDELPEATNSQRADQQSLPTNIATPQEPAVDESALHEQIQTIIAANPALLAPVQNDGRPKPPDITSPRGLSLLLDFVRFARNNPNPNRAMVDFLAAKKDDYNPPLTETYLQNGLFDFALVENIEELVANLDTVEKKLIDTTKVARELATPQTFDQPLLHDQVARLRSDDRKRDVSYQGVINELDIVLSRHDKRVYNEQIVPEQVAALRDEAQINHSLTIDTALGQVTTQAQLNPNAIAFIKEKSYELLLTEPFTTNEQLITALGKQLPSDISPAILATIITPTVFQQISEPIYQAAQVQETATIIERFRGIEDQFLSGAQEVIKQVSEPTERITAIPAYQESGIKNGLQLRLDKQLAKLSSEGVVTPELYNQLHDKLLNKSIYHVKTAIANYTDAVEQKNIAIAIRGAISHAVEETMPGVDGKVILEKLDLYDSEAPIIDDQLTTYIAISRIERLQPLVAELDAEATTETLGLLNQLTVSELVRLNPSLQDLVSQYSSVVSQGKQAPFIAENATLAWQEGMTAEDLPVYEELAAEAARKKAEELTALRAAERQNTPTGDQAVAQQQAIEQTQQELTAATTAQALVGVAEQSGDRGAVTAITTVTTSVYSIYTVLTSAVAQNNVPAARTAAALYTNQQDQKSSFFNLFKSGLNYKLLHRLPKEAVSFDHYYADFIVPLLEKYKDNPALFTEQAAKLVQNWVFYNQHNLLAKILLGKFKPVTIIAEKDLHEIPPELVKYYRNKLALATGKWIYKRSKRLIVAGSKKTIIPWGKNVGGLVYNAAAKPVTYSKNLAFKTYRYLSGRPIIQGAAQSRAGRFINQIKISTQNVGRTISHGATKLTAPARKALNRIALKIAVVLKKFAAILGKIAIIRKFYTYAYKILKRAIQIFAAYLYALYLFLGATLAAAITIATGAIIGAIIGAALALSVAGAVVSFIAGAIGLGIVGVIVGVSAAVLLVIVAALVGAAIGAAIAALLYYTFVNFILPNLPAALFAGTASAALGLAIGLGWWTFPFAAAGFFIGAGIVWLWRYFLWPRFSLRIELNLAALLNGLWNALLNALSQVGALIQSFLAAIGAGSAIGLVVSLLVPGSILIIGIIVGIIAIISTPHTPNGKNEPQLNKAGPAQVDNGQQINYTLSANLPSCSSAVTIDDPLPSNTTPGDITDPVIKTGGLIKTIEATVSDHKISWVLTMLNSCSQTTSQTTSVSFAGLPSSYGLTQDFCQGANPNGCSAALAQTFYSAATWANIPAGVIAGIANQEWKATFKHTDGEINQWEQPGVVAEPNGPANHPRFINGCAQSFAGAEGPFQFLTGKANQPNIWGSYQSAVVDAGARQQDYTGQACNLLDAAYGAAKKLKLNSGLGFATKKDQWTQDDVYTVARAYLGACIPNYNPSLNYCEGVWQYYKTFTPRQL